MTRFFTLFTVIALAVPAYAQAPGAVPTPAPSEPPIASFLEKRVPDELAVEGVMLSRRNLTLKVEQVGAQLLISLVDLTTDRVAASTKMDTLPPDREAAVAAVTQVVAELSRQVGPEAVAADESRAEREQHEVAELRFKRDSIRFGDRYELEGGKVPTLSRHWVTFRGDLDRELDPVEFYTTVGRPELGEEYTSRLHIQEGAFAIGSVAALAGLVVMAIGGSTAAGETGNCLVTDPNFSSCVSAGQARQTSDLKSYGLGAGLLFGGGMIGIGVAAYYHYHVHPITEGEAMSLADAYNDGLRHQLGLPTASLEDTHVIESLKISPFSTGHGDGGFALTGTF